MSKSWLLSLLTLAAFAEKTSADILSSAAIGLPSPGMDLPFSAAPVPEPATYVLMGLGVLICAQQFRRKKK